MSEQPCNTVSKTESSSVDCYCNLKRQRVTEKCNGLRQHHTKTQAAQRQASRVYLRNLPLPSQRTRKQKSVLEWVRKCHLMLLQTFSKSFPATPMLHVTMCNQALISVWKMEKATAVWEMNSPGQRKPLWSRCPAVSCLNAWLLSLCCTRGAACHTGGPVSVQSNASELEFKCFKRPRTSSN